MDLVTAVRQYIAEMCRIAGPGMKAMLLDKHTTGIVSCVYAQSEMMHKEVYLFERLDSGASRDPIKYLKCVVFVRPSPENVQLLCQELRAPKYGQYYIYFSNVISKREIKRLAEADEQECVRELNEFYADFVALGAHLFSLNIPLCYQQLTMPAAALRRCAHALASVLLAVKKHPVIRFEASSKSARALAEQLAAQLTNEAQLFDFRRPDVPPVLVIVDRKDDAVTPLLNQWTYQAMVHELLGIQNNRVSLQSVPNIEPAMKEVVLSPLHDEFYASNLYSNFGEIAENIKGLMDEFQKRAQTHRKVESIADMKQFVEQYPQFKKISGTATKHVTVIGELSRLTTMYNLLEVSELEQNLACHDDHSNSLQELRRLLSDERTSDLDATRLVMLYALRYESHNNNDINALVNALRKRGVPEQYYKAVNDLLEFGGVHARSSDLYGTTNASAIAKKFIKGLKGVDNIYTQHQPHLLQVLDQLARGRLGDGQYPVAHGTANTRVSDVIVFVVGGVTYEEAAAVNAFNRAPNGCRVVLGGTFCHNGRSFIEEVINAADGALPRRSAGRKQPLM